ncbi:MAG: class I SAM-dependent RNA methyltransferase [Pseudomonadota bacterium]
MADLLEIFFVCIPGLEPELLAEAREHFPEARAARGGVELRGTWEDVWRANLVLRGATRVLARIGHIEARSLKALEQQAARFPWQQHVAPREPVRLDVTCRKSRIAHAGAAAQKLERALRVAAIPVVPKAAITLKARIDGDRCTFSIDTSGAPLHKRGFKEAVGKAPLRETMAALLLRRAGFRLGETVVDPFCGSGTFPIEAADIASGRLAGSSREFAFERLPSFNAAKYRLLTTRRADTPGRYFGFDRDAGAVRMAKANAARAGLSCEFEQRDVADLLAPDTEPGLVICNPPYGDRIGHAPALKPLYATLGARLSTHFQGWRVGILTSDPQLANASGLSFQPKGPPIAHGGLKVWFFQTGPLVAASN